MADTLEQLLQGVQSYKSGAEAATRKVLEALGTQASITQGIAKTYDQQASDDVVVQTAKSAADYETQLSRVKAANLAGANLKNSNEVITGLSAAAQDAYNRKDAALKEIQKKRDVGLFDNPLKFIVNSITVNDDIAKHNIADFQLEAAQTRIAAVNAQAQTTIQTQNAISEPLTALSMQASARTAAVAATVAARQADIAGLNYNVKGIEFAMGAAKETLALEFQAQGARNAATSLALQQENAAQSRIEFSYRQKEYQERAADKVAQEDMGRSVVDTVNLGRKALLQDKYTPLDDMSGKMVISALKSKGVLSEEYKVYYEAGTRSKLEGKVMLGSTPAAAAAVLQSIPVQLNSTQGPIKQLLGQAWQDTDNGLKELASTGKSTNPVFAGVNPKDKSSTTKAYNDRAQQLLDSYAAKINPDDGSNPYQIASVNQLAANSATVRDLAVVRKVLAPIMKAGTQLTDAKQVMSLVSDALSAGKITQKEALEIPTIYHVGVLANNAMRNFEGFGLRSSNKYNAVVEINPDAFSPTAIVNMTDPISYGRALNKIQAGRMQKEFSEGTRNMVSGKKDNTGMSLFDSRGVAPDSMFQPNPRAAKALEAAADSVGSSVENFFKTLPRSSNARKN